MSTVVGRGLAAGAAGATVLNAVTHLDMAWRGRPASESPEQVVDALAGVLNTAVPGRGQQQDNRRTALGALSGIATGLAAGVLASAARSAGIRLPGVFGAAATGAAAMAASDLPLAGFRISDPRGWTTREWVSDAVPHLAYGLAVHAVLDAEPDADGIAAQVQTRPSVGLVLRSALLGTATGMRSSLGLAGPVLSAPHRSGAAAAVTGRPGGAVATSAVIGELVADKLPNTPSRLDALGLPLRFVSGAAGATALARREGARVALPVLLGLGGAAAGSWGGAAWRSWWSSSRPDWQGALIEDAVALSLALVACTPGRRG